jgi:hypothetical protein
MRLSPGENQLESTIVEVPPLAEAVRTPRPAPSLRRFVYIPKNSPFFGDRMVVWVITARHFSAYCQERPVSKSGIINHRVRAYVLWPVGNVPRSARWWARSEHRKPATRQCIHPGFIQADHYDQWHSFWLPTRLWEKYSISGHLKILLFTRLALFDCLESM